MQTLFYGHLDLTDIRQYRTTAPPISLLYQGYTVLKLYVDHIVKFEPDRQKQGT